MTNTKLTTQYDIERIYSNLITDYLNHGWQIYPVTMSGTQGEIAKVDLIYVRRDSKGYGDLIRILLETKMVFPKDSLPCDAVVITVGRWNEPLIQHRPFDTFSTTVWNNRLEVISERTFYQIAYEKDLYTEDAEEMAKIERKRRERRNYDRGITPIYGAEKIVKPFLQRVSNRKKIDELDIKVGKRFNGLRNVYTVSYRGNDYRMG